MEWAVPIQKIDASKIQVGSLQKTAKPITSLSYSDGTFHFQHLNILLPPLPVKEYDATTGKLVLNLSEFKSTSQRLFSVQETILNTVYHQQKQWFSDSDRSPDQIQSLFQPFVENDLLHLYCPLQTQEKKYGLSLWKEGSWKKLTVPGLFQKGDLLRVGLRLQGISFQMNVNTGSWTGRFRVQHRIFCMYHCNKS